jgi:hypothetical protein
MATIKQNKKIMILRSVNRFAKMFIIPELRSITNFVQSYSMFQIT